MSGSYSEVVKIAAGSAVIGGITLVDATTPTQGATVTAFHNLDNHTIPGSGNGLLTGGVAQLINAGGALDRARETGFDGVPAVGIATGTQQTHQPYATTTTQSVSASASAQAVTLNAVTFTARGSTVTIAPGSSLLVDTGANQETVFVTAVNTGTKAVTAIFTKAHSSGVAVIGSAYNQAKDGTIGDGVSGAGLAAAVTYIWDAGSATFSSERAATSDAVPGTAVLIEGVGLYNGATFDRQRAATADGMATTGIAAEGLMLWNGSTFDRATGSATRGLDVNIKPLNYTFCGAVNVTGTSGLLANCGTLTSELVITNPGTLDIWMNPVNNGTAVVGQGLRCGAGLSFTFGSGSVRLPTGTLNAIIASGTISAGLAGG